MKESLRYLGRISFWPFVGKKSPQFPLTPVNELRLKAKAKEAFSRTKNKEKQSSLSPVENHVKEETSNESNSENKFFLSSYIYWPTKTRPSLDAYLPKKKATQEERTQKVQVVEDKSLSSRGDIDDRTYNLLNNLRAKHTFTDPFYIRRLQDLCKHLRIYPETQGIALKHESVGLILSIIEENKENQSTKLQCHEALAMLGHHGPLPGRGIRILSIDGGGMRGIVGLQMLKKFEEETGRKIHRLFDLIVGVSTGAIIASFLGFHKKSVSEIEETYKTIGSRIFTQNQMDGVRGWVLTHSFYNTKSYEDILKSFVGEFPMHGLNRNIHTTPKVAIISSHVTEHRITPYVFRSYTLPYLVHSSFNGSSKYPVWAAVRASSAAPGYFDEFSLDNQIFHDGGILVNNATHIAIHEARRLWPKERLHCVVSLGLGRNEMPLENSSLAMPKGLSIHQKFARIVDSATDTELVHETLNDNLERNVYYRFNPYLPEYLPLDEKRPVKMKMMAEAADMYLRRNRIKFTEACRTLVEPRAPHELICDHLKKQHEIIKTSMYRP